MKPKFIGEKLCKTCARADVNETGLLDVSGRKIVVGDVLEIDNDYGNFNYFLVVFDKEFTRYVGSYGFGGNRTGGYVVLSVYAHMKVLGNVKDNPELEEKTRNYELSTWSYENEK